MCGLYVRVFMQQC